MANISIDLDGARKVDAFLSAFPKDTSKAILRALKRGTKSAFTEAKRTAAKDMGLKQRDVAKELQVINPNGRTLSGGVRATTKRIPLIKFGAKGPEPSRGKGRGVSYRVGRSRQRNPRAFIETVGGHRGVFERRFRSRLPILELFGPSVGRVIARNDSAIAAKGEKDSRRELDRLIDRIIGGPSG